MDWTNEAIGSLRDAEHWSYAATGTGASEPAALAALALTTHGEHAAARRALDWLAAEQAADGSLGVAAGRPEPRWPTALAMLAWRAAPRADGHDQAYDTHVERALAWALATAGEKVEAPGVIGHDGTLQGWPWVAGTHSWLEPTALFVLALRATGHGEHARTREAVRLLIDRLLPDGGCNYGNTTVLGQPLLPHVQPTGVAMLALGGVDVEDERIGRSLALLERASLDETSTVSLCWAVLGLAAHGRATDTAAPALADAWQRAKGRGTLRTALLVLAARGHRSPLVDVHGSTT